jgi:lipopolysaccharide export system permease protein
VSPWVIIRPLVAVGLLLSGLVFWVQEGFAPQAAFTTSSIKSNYLEKPPDPNKPRQVLRTIQHLAAYGQGHALLYAKTFDPVEKRMEGIVILQQGPDLRMIRKITAQEALWTGSEWRFLHGTILHFNHQGEPVGKPALFESKIIPAGDRPEILAKADSEAELMNMRDLRRYIRRLAAAGGATTGKLKVDLYAKPAAALACLVLTIVGIPFAVSSARGAGAILGLSMGLGVGLVYYGANALVVALGKGGWLPPLAAAWGVPLLFLALGLRLTWRRLA